MGHQNPGKGTGHARSATALELDFCYHCGDALPADLDERAVRTDCPSCGRTVILSHEALAVDDDFAETAAPAELTIESAPDRELRFSLPLIEGVAWRRSVLLGFVTIAVAHLFLLAIDPSLFDLTGFVGEQGKTFVAALFTAWMTFCGLFFAFAKISVTVTANDLRVRYHWGRLGFSRSTSNANIQRVIAAGIHEAIPPYGESVDSQSRWTPIWAVVVSPQRRIWLTFAHGRQTVRYVSRLVGRHIISMGHELDDAQSQGKS